MPSRSWGGGHFLDSAARTLDTETRAGRFSGRWGSSRSLSSMGREAKCCNGSRGEAQSAGRCVLTMAMSWRRNRRTCAGSAATRATGSRGSRAARRRERAAVATMTARAAAAAWGGTTLCFRSSWGAPPPLPSRCHHRCHHRQPGRPQRPAPRRPARESREMPRGAARPAPWMGSSTEALRRPGPRNARADRRGSNRQVWESSANHIEHNFFTNTVTMHGPARPPPRRITLEKRSSNRHAHACSAYSSHVMRRAWAGQRRAGSARRSPCEETPPSLASWAKSTTR